MAAYYNESDPFAAGWLRELIAAGHIAPGEVDERSIEDVTADDLKGFTQCHFFAGIGVWSHALRLAGWADDRVVWTGSCPCQPFSAAGKRGGTDDERHLWPAFFHLIDKCRPPVVLGEQVASKDGLAWLDLVSSDMEGAGYAFGAVDTCAAGFGAPHIRQRLWFVGIEGIHDAAGSRQFAEGAGAEGEARHEAWLRGPECGRGIDGVADASSESESGRGVFGQRQSDGESAGPACERPSGLCTDGRLADSDNQGLEGRQQSRCEGAAECAAGSGELAGGVADSDGWDTGTEGLQRSGEQRQQPQDGGAGERLGEPDSAGSQQGEQRSTAMGYRSTAIAAGSAGQRPGPLNGFWRDADWLLCRDGRWRPVKPGTFPLAHGVANRVGLLRGAGNAIVLEQAAGFVEAVMDALGRS